MCRRGVVWPSGAACRLTPDLSIDLFLIGEALVVREEVGSS